LAVAALAACSSTSSSPSGGNNADAGTTADAEPAPDDGGATQDAPADSAANATWTYLYTTYFASGTPGHCGNGGCHASSQGGFKCGSDKTTCYNGLVTAKLIGTTNATQPLVNPKVTPLAWFNSGGAMPEDNPVANPAAVKDLQAWVAAGATND
jgi:hypothetical protein